MSGNGTLLTMLVLAGVIPTGTSDILPKESCIRARVIGRMTTPSGKAMYMPTDVAVNTAGQVFVADGVKNRVIVFGKKWVFESEITAVGGKKLNRPIAVTIDKANRLWIADTGNRQLLVVLANGKLGERIDLPKPRPVATEATGLAVSENGDRTFVVDNDNHRLLIRDNRDGTWRSLGSRGRSLGQFQWPFMVCVGLHGYAYVTEVMGTRVQLVSPDGQWAGFLGRWGIRPGQLYRPKGIAADAKGRLFVSDSTLGVVQVFGPRGHLEGVLTEKDSRPLRFDHPMGMCFDTTGRLYVVELQANRVAVVELSGTSIRDAIRPAAKTDQGIAP